MTHPTINGKIETWIQVPSTQSQEITIIFNNFILNHIWTRMWFLTRLPMDKTRWGGWQDGSVKGSYGQAQSLIICSLGTRKVKTNSKLSLTSPQCCGRYSPTNKIMCVCGNHLDEVFKNSTTDFRLIKITDLVLLHPK